MQSPSEENEIQKAGHACRTCYKRKIRCDRLQPQCSPCRTNGRDCNYISTSEPTPRQSLKGRSPVHEVNETELDRKLQWSTAVRFLDWDVFQRSRIDLGLPGRSLTIPPDILALLGDHQEIQKTTTLYFERVSTWLPIISKQKLYATLLNPLVDFRADTAFLCLCMSLHATPLPPGSSPQGSYYQAAKHFFVYLQSYGCMSLELLQGCILMAVYELGHAIYPAASLMTGVCIKLAVALHLTFDTTDQHASPAPGTPSSSSGLTQHDSEERRRTLWAVYLIERFANIGNPAESLLCPEPAFSSLLPCSNESWQQEQAYEEGPPLSAPPESAGRFARVVQTAYLLSCVYRHVREPSQLPEFHDQELEQLDRTLHAQLRYNNETTAEGPDTRVKCYQTALTYSAFLLLYATHFEPHDPLQQRAEYILNHATDHLLEVLPVLTRSYETILQEPGLSPFQTPWLYLVGMRLQQRGKLDELSKVQQGLEAVQIQWRAADVYLNMLRARQVMDL